MGNGLEVRSAQAEDDSFYRCVAKNEAGVGVGYRKLSVQLPAADWRVIWVECDENGRPIRTTYVPARGDVPSDDKALLPWKTEFQGTKETHFPLSSLTGITPSCRWLISADFSGSSGISRRTKCWRR